MRKIAESGQCFRLNEVGPGDFHLVALGRFLRITETEKGCYTFHCSEEEYRKFWHSYFDLGTDYGLFSSAIPVEDSFLSRAAEAGEGIRILRQDPWEMLITFIISQRKNIPAIKKAVELLSERYGEPMVGEGALEEGPQPFAFPTAKVLACLSLEELKACSLGYRAPYILAASKMVAEGELMLEEIAELEDADLFQQLLRVPGVGEKVANCVLLFGFYRIGAFPRDVWINRVIEEEYGGNFPLELYEGYGGVIQQYMFYYGRQKTLKKL